MVADKPPLPGEGFPQSLKPQSRIPQKSTKFFNGFPVTISPWKGSPLPREHFPSLCEPAALVVDIRSDSAQSALDKIDYLLELIIDHLSFQLQIPISIFQLEVIDASEPFTEGLTRENLVYPFPRGYSFAKSLISNPVGDILTLLIPTLDNDILSIEKRTRTRAVLRWYVKGLSSPYEIDKFIYFWVCLEILSADSEISVEGLYKAPCGHEIPNCPICNKPTIKKVQGKTLKRFLTEGLFVDEKIAKELWKMRQMIHGANNLSSKETLKLPELVQKLKKAVLFGLKMKLNIGQDQAPIIIQENVSIGMIALGGKREITKTDIEYSCTDF